MAKVDDYIRVIGENIEGVVYKRNPQYLVGKYKRSGLSGHGLSETRTPSISDFPVIRVLIRF